MPSFAAPRTRPGGFCCGVRTGHKDCMQPDEAYTLVQITVEVERGSLYDYHLLREFL